MQYKMCKGPYFASKKKVEGSILFHGTLNSIMFKCWYEGIYVRQYLMFEILLQMLYELLLSCKVGQLCFLAH